MFNWIGMLNTIFIVVINIYIWSKLLNKRLNFKIINTYLLFILLTIIMFLNYYYVNNFFKIFTITLIMMVVCKFLFGESINKAIITPIFSQLMIMGAELIFVIAVLFITGITNNHQFVDNYFGSIAGNVSIALISYILMRFKCCYKLYDYFLKITCNFRKIKLVFYLVILVITINLLQASMYYKIDFIWFIIMNIVLMMIYFVIIVKMANVKNKYLIISQRYNDSKNSLLEYQTVVNRYRVDNHENKNQLKTLRGKLDVKNKEAIKYIDMILNTRVKANEQLFNKANVIPKGDLRILIDAKIMTMDEKSITYSLHVDKQIKAITFIEFDEELINDICKIVGVYLDNAIDAVSNIKEKEIAISMYEENNWLYITIANTFEGVIDTTKISKIGYTTKGDEHGYGLSLVAQIIQHNYKLVSNTCIDNNVFKQVLKIKM
ncbi:MAG: GHKL domain-containing protein [Bacilli bacterium]